MRECACLTQIVLFYGLLRQSSSESYACMSLVLAWLFLFVNLRVSEGRGWGFASRSHSHALSWQLQTRDDRVNHTRTESETKDRPVADGDRAVGDSDVGLAASNNGGDAAAAAPSSASARRRLMLVVDVTLVDQMLSIEQTHHFLITLPCLFKRHHAHESLQPRHIIDSCIFADGKRKSAAG